MKLFMKIYIIVSISFFSLYGSTLRIEPQKLVKNISNYTILDTRSATLFNEAHIRGSLNFPISTTYDNQKINGKISSPDKISKILRKLGLNIDDKIVVYDDGAFFDAARLFWTLEVYGFKNIKMLNMGFNDWQFKEYPTSTKIKSVTPSNYITTINSKRLATKFTTQIATQNPNQLIIDARAVPAYNGKNSSAKRFGHIPSAKNIPATKNINHNIQNTSLKSLEELKKIYKGLDKNKKIIIYCAVGRISSTNYFALRELGYDVSNYDSSWKEWGNDFSLPIVSPK